MPTSPTLAEALAEPLLRLYLDAELVLLARVARRIARGIDSPIWAHEKLVEVEALRREVEAQIGTLTAEGIAEVRRAVDEAYARGTAAAATDVHAPVVTSTFFRVNRRAVEALAAETVGAVQATHLRILRSTLDAYRQAVSDGVAQVAIGTLTRRETAQQTLDRLLGSGITGFLDRGGRGWDMASYVEMAVRTGAGHAAVQGSLDRLEAAGRDLVVVSNAPGECARCRPWEGKQLSISGRTPGYRTVADARSGGLFHPGCRHGLHAVIEGLTQPMGPTADPEGDAARQQQRYLERQAREWKRRAALALDEQTRQQANAKVRQWQARIRDHVAATGGKRLYYRESVSRAR